MNEILKESLINKFKPNLLNDSKISNEKINIKEVGIELAKKHLEKISIKV